MQRTTIESSRFGASFRGIGRLGSTLVSTKVTGQSAKIFNKNLISHNITNPHP